MKENIKIIVDLQCFASVDWYKKVYNYSDVEMFIYEPHKKMSLRNRIVIAGGNGMMNLSVPLVDGRNEKLLYSDIKIAGQPWQRDHWRGIVSAYNRSPWFEYYRDDLAVMFERPYRFLIDFNRDALEWVQSKMKFPVRFKFSDEQPVPGSSGGADDFRNHLMPSNRKEWAGGKDAVQAYGQVFRDRNGFIPGLSILDLLFCEGPAASQWLRPDRSVEG